jgi:hypothetical protein
MSNNARRAPPREAERDIAVITYPAVGQYEVQIHSNR